MPRSTRSAPAGYVYHAMNRGVARLKLFRKPADYDAFLRVLEEALQKHPIRLLSYCVMPTHWHLVLWPQTDHQLSDFLHWLTLTHSVRWHRHYHSTGSGHLYQNRFKAFPTEDNEHLYTVLRYVERNALRAGLVERAEDWLWSSLYAREKQTPLAAHLADWPVALPEDWVEQVNEPQTEAELEDLRTSVNRGRPFGSKNWMDKTVRTLNLEHTLRSRGRPPKQTE